MRGVVRVPSDTLSFREPLLYSLGIHKWKLHLPLHPNKENHSAPYQSVNYIGLLSCQTAGDGQAAWEEHLWDMVVRKDPALSYESPTATSTEPLVTMWDMSHGAWRADLFFMVPSSCHTSGNQKSATRGLVLALFVYGPFSHKFGAGVRGRMISVL